MDSLRSALLGDSAQRAALVRNPASCLYSVSMGQPAKSQPRTALVAAGFTHKGKRRSHNEDAILVREDLRLFVVADGAGGHNAGEVASALVVKSIENYFEATEPNVCERPELDQHGLPIQLRRLAASVQKANSDVREIARSSFARAGMGSTVVAALFAPSWQRLYVAHVGDSRCYRLRGPHVEVLTHDHTMVNDILELRPDVGDSVLQRLPLNVVTRALGMADKVRVELRTHDLSPGDRYVLCSDGLSRQVREDVLFGASGSPEEPAFVARQLITVANDAGGADNISAVVIDYERDGRHAAAAPLHVSESASGDSHEPPAVPRSGTTPEILLLGLDGDAESEARAEVVVLPADSADTGMLEAVETLVAPLRPGDSADNGASHSAATVQCVECDREIPAHGKFCPYCGHDRR
ncbi:MAG: protein phosphatase 2C domain-containing protein [Polyangiaceae bacterium]|nr:protein phosphatase 2C domain-containing protein [Polyangiaceae bacterium]